MSEWIAFKDRKPTGTVHVASHNQCHPDPVSGGTARIMHENGTKGACTTWTHWCPCQPPTDLPPEPDPDLPELPEGWQWIRVEGLYVARRDFADVWIAGGSVVSDMAGPIPFAVIDALREANGCAKPEPDLPPLDEESRWDEDRQMVEMGGYGGLCGVDGDGDFFIVSGSRRLFARLDDVRHVLARYDREGGSETAVFAE